VDAPLARLFLAGPRARAEARTSRGGEGQGRRGGCADVGGANGGGALGRADGDAAAVRRAGFPQPRAAAHPLDGDERARPICPCAPRLGGAFLPGRHSLASAFPPRAACVGLLPGGIIPGPASHSLPFLSSPFSVLARALRERSLSSQLAVMLAAACVPPLSHATS